ncbi:AAA family ATPase [Flavobacterium lacisediminis]|uniref:AAA family ATPase n=1 Tax=Flavobacterium lacisediminis TaxID=2989705 RepID=A0ABT3EL92_9FLAO|nr:AAA family ATPase [Flavobacterium lacisediminis]MCW1149161.1 AAA family ATPase [Flavobacterium lacisediminis]
MNENLYQLKETFLQEWPLSRIQNMTLEEYTNLDKTSFCYWLEAKTYHLGSIWGGSAYKFGIFKRRNLESTTTKESLLTDGEYSWAKKYGDTKEMAFQNIKNILLAIIENTQNNSIEHIDEIDLGDAYKWKIAFLYGNFNVVNIFKKESLLESAQSLGYTDVSKKYTDLNRYILSKKVLEQDYFDFTADLWKKTTLANSFSEIIENFKSYLEFSETNIHDFTFNDKRKGKKWIWISDSKNIIGKEDFCHYELITRPKHPQKVCVEIHFEHKKSKQDLYKNLLNDKLSEQFFWNKDHGAEELSLAYFESIEFSDPKINEKIEQALLKLDETFGNTLRNYALEIDNKKGTILKTPLNQILYGPPGTGKTFNTINNALEIINDEEVKALNFDNREAVKDLFEKKAKENQIDFITFHQSMSYEDFIEGIKPETKNEKVTYAIKDGIFKTITKNALIEYIKDGSENESNDDFENLYNDFIENIKPFEGKREGIFKTKTGVEIMLVNANKDSILIKYLWSNNKKVSEGQHTFSVTKEKLKRVLVEGIEPNKIKNLKTELHPLVGHIHCELFAVYKKFYDFVIDTKGEIDAVHFDNLDLTYEEVKEQFDKLTKEQIKNKLVKPYVLIIDEINRGNVSQIFGELITLIEDSKRLGKEEALEVTLPYSKEKFGVPPNLYIIGTMNTADRSVEALDTALRRRFSFVEMPPKYDLYGLKYKISDYEASEILRTINTRIEKLIDKDHAIGHAYFLNKTYTSIVESFYKNIIPLLQEYFFGDYGKIGLVLGKGFVKLKEYQKETTVFADFDTDSANDFEERNVYEIIDYRVTDNFVLKIKNTEVAMNFEKAIQVLMNKKFE